MSEWTDDVDTEEEESARRHDVKRAVLGGVAGVALLVGPIALANAVVPDDEHDDVTTEDQASGTSLIALQQQRHASDADVARLAGGLSLRTTTTTAPPTTTTTTAPPTTTTTTAPPTTTTTEPPPPPTEVDPPPDTGGSLGDPYNYASWDALAECESGGNWQINTGNGYYGGIQFSLSSWQGVGGTGYPHEHTRETQIAMGIRLWEGSGWGAWPACSSELGYR
jgi:hypothetical protein